MDLDEETLAALLNPSLWEALEDALSIARAAGLTAKRHNRKAWLKQPHVRRAERQRKAEWTRTQAGRESRAAADRKYRAKSSTKAKRAAYERARRQRQKARKG